MQDPLVKLGFFVVVSCAYTATIVASKPPGIVRLLSSFPVILFFIVAPLQFEKVSLAGGFGFIFTWLANFKLLAFSAGRGPLAHPGLNGLQFCLMLLLPFYTTKGSQAAHAVSVTAALSVKVAATGALTVLLTSEAGSGMSTLARHFCYALYIYLFVSLLLDSLIPLGVHALRGAPLQPAMEAPFMSRSVREFWGRRYNQIVSCALYDVVYLPVLQGSWVTPPSWHIKGRKGVSKSRKLLALTAAFLVSGLMHEVCVWYMCRQLSGGGRLMLFFALQPAIIAVEEALKAQLPPAVRAARWFSVVEVVVTLAAVLMSAEQLFWAPLEMCHVDRRGLGEMMELMGSIKSRVWGV